MFKMKDGWQPDIPLVLDQPTRDLISVLSVSEPLFDGLFVWFLSDFDVISVNVHVIIEIFYPCHR
jgi:hypothetical protein